MTRILKYLGIAAALSLLLAGFLPWVHIASKDLTITGINTEGTNFGKPAWFHFVFLFFFLVLTIIPKLWAKRANLVIIVFNLAWAIRNFLVISRCEAGDCPEKEIGIYLVLFCSLIMAISSLFPDMKLKEEK